MIQYRDPPAYQEYAASMLANYNFRALDLKARGALYTLRLECWVNKRLPADPDTLSRALGLSKDELFKVQPMLDPFFKIEDGWLFSPELEDYRTYLDSRKKAQSEGGKKGAAKTNSRLKVQQEESQVTRQVTRDSLVKQSKDQFSKGQHRSVSKGVVEDHPDWQDF
jgi:uncharacterized protein YdaU (DUF1376 family)